MLTTRICYKKQPLATAAVIKNGTSKNILSTCARSSTGVRGVSYNKASCKYEAKLMYQGKIRFRQTYDTLDEAIKARKTAEKMD